jgi:hypothetical protein
MSDQSQSARSPLIRLLLVLLPLAAMLASFVWIASLDPLRSFNNGAPPVEALTVERTILDETGIQVLVRAGGSEAMIIAQVAVDDAYWSFTQDPIGPIPRGDAVWVRISYPWVLGEAHRVALVSNTGTVFEHEIAVAVPTPKADAGQLRLQALVGAIVGLLPVALGLMFYPAMRGLGRQGMNVLLALTVGLLAFLLIDMTGEALELAADAAALFQGSAMVWLTALASFLLLMARCWRGNLRGWRWPSTSRLASAFTTSAKGWPLVGRSPPDQRDLARSSSSALPCTMSPKASGSQHPSCGSAHRCGPSPR